MKINFIDKEIEGPKELQNVPFTDERGEFLNFFKLEDPVFKKLWGKREVKQINLSRTKKRGTIRGMHMQLEPFAEAKLISCIKGEIWDVFLDLRVGSPSFGKYSYIVLSQNLKNSLFIPEGFAHGFQALQNDVEMIYIHSNKWSKSHETGVNCKDKTLKIPWPISDYNLSERDRNLPNFKKT